MNADHRIQARIAHPTDDDMPIDDGARNTAIETERTADGGVVVLLYDVGTVLLLDANNAAALRDALSHRLLGDPA